MAQIAVAAVSLVGGIYKGRKAKELKKEEAKGIRDAAGRTVAITSRDVVEAERKKEHMYSTAIVAAGKSGAGTEGLTKLLADLNTEGEYNIMATLWNGLNEAEGLQYRAEAAEREGKAAETAGWIDGVTSAVSSYVGMGGTFGTGSGKINSGLGLGAELSPDGLPHSPVSNRQRTTLWSGT